MTRILDPASDPAPSAPDLVLVGSGLLSGSRFDFALAGPNDRANPLGLRAGQLLATAIALCLWSDGRGEPDPLQSGEMDLRGWPGDGFDLDTSRGEAPVGSVIWTRFRFPANADNAAAIARAAETSLQPLVRQGLLGQATFTGTAEPASNRISLAVRLAAPDGRVIYDGPFAGLWEALLAVRHPLAP